MQQAANLKIQRRRPPSTQNPLTADVPRLLAHVYQLRGITSPEEVNGSITQLLAPDHLLNIKAAAQLIVQAIEQQRQIVVVGDYDADGATSTAVLMRFMRQIGFSSIRYFVPNRFEYGYGLTPEIVDAVKADKPDLIITVDNGISSISGVSYANQCGIQVLVTDHHLPGDRLPDAEVIINPNQPGDQFESKALAGVGVLFYLLLEVRRQLIACDWFAKNGRQPVNLAQYLDLVALGTVADVVPLDRNNRVLVEQGLRRIRAGRCCPGITALLKLGRRSLRNVVASDLGFVVGPRINAAGRLDDISIGIECLLTDDVHRAGELAQLLDSLNAERKEIEQEMTAQANQFVEQIERELDGQQLPRGLCAYQADWHQGVTGIVASRLKEHYHRPTIVFARTDSGELKGSARSIPGIHIRDVLDWVAANHPDLIIKFGGHAMAAGLSILESDFAHFNEQFNVALQVCATAEMFDPVVYTDGELHDNEYSLELANMLRSGGPWGQGFPEPLFDGEFRILTTRILAEHHVKLELQVKNGNARVSGIAFNYQKVGWHESLRTIRAVFHLDVNEFRGHSTCQLNIRHIEPIEP